MHINDISNDAGFFINPINGRKIRNNDPQKIIADQLYQQLMMEAQVQTLAMDDEIQEPQNKISVGRLIMFIRRGYWDISVLEEFKNYGIITEKTYNDIIGGNII